MKKIKYNVKKNIMPNFFIYFYFYKKGIKGAFFGIEENYGFRFKCMGCRK